MARNMNTDFPTKTEAPSASYPNGAFRNVTVTGDGTGTPWDALIMNDVAGFQQELLDKAGLTPDGNNEKVGASQYFDAMRLTCGYPGLIQVAALFNVVPSSLGLRLLKLDGSGVLVASYPELDNATWVGVIDNASSDGFYRADDAAGTSRNIGGAYLILPDMTGQFIRGRDLTGAVDPDGASRAAAKIQDWALYDHAHIVEEKGTGYKQEGRTFQEGTGSSQFVAVFPSTPTGNQAYGSDMYENDLATAISTNKSTDENRPTNMNFDFYVWY